MMFYGVYKIMWREMRMKQQNLSQKYRKIELDKFKKMLHVKDTATSMRRHL
jgi:superfamily II DNA helicase RecQ